MAGHQRLRLAIIKGTRFGKWTITGEVMTEGDPKYRRMTATCDCGTEGTPLLLNLRNGNSQSCGCARISTIAGHREWKP